MDEKKEFQKKDLKELVHEELKKLGQEQEKKEIPHEERKEIAQEKHPALKEESKKDLESDLIRLQAEFENYRKRTQKELGERAELGKMEFAQSQISFLDEFENAVSHFKGEEKKGMEMLLSNFKKSLSAHGVREMESMGKKFDPYLHDVIAQQESEKPEGTIVAVARKGYYFKEKVLRHAQVIVAKKIEKKE
ncbi:Protein GrpE [uncultured archaeon]|nr:Protein GrpE [uncultured archaeon]